MIKINLAPSAKAIRVKKDIGSANEPENASLDISQLQKQGAIKIVVLLLVPFALYAYEMQAIPEKRNTLSSKKTVIAGLIAKNEKAKTAIEETQKYKQDQQRLQAQIQTIESLSKDRLKTIKILDTIQRDIPEKIWLTKLDVNETRVVMNGLAKADSDLTLFMDALQKSIHFQEVNLIRSKEETSGNTNLKQFEINCIIEKGAAPTAGGGA